MMWLKISKAIFILATLFCATLQEQLPSNFKKCRRNDPNVNDCYRKAIQDALPKLKYGIKELGVPTIEPLIVPEVHIAANSDSPVRFSQDFKDFKIYNTSTSIIKSVDIHLKDDKFSMTLESETEEVVFDSEYEISGRILLLPISGNGRSIFRLKNVNLHMYLDTEPFIKGGETYIKVANISVSTTLSKLTMNFQNLFNGNKELGDQINQVLNDNWQQVYTDLGKSYTELFEAVYADYNNRIFSKIPYKDLFEK